MRINYNELFLDKYPNLGIRLDSGSTPFALSLLFLFPLYSRVLHHEPTISVLLRATRKTSLAVDSVSARIHALRSASTDTKRKYSHPGTILFPLVNNTHRPDRALPVQLPLTVSDPLRENTSLRVSSSLTFTRSHLTHVHTVAPHPRSHGRILFTYIARTLGTHVTRSHPLHVQSMYLGHSRSHGRTLFTYTARALGPHVDILTTSL
jgi:hypothetical protein